MPTTKNYKNINPFYNEKVNDSDEKMRIALNAENICKCISRMPKCSD